MRIVRFVWHALLILIIPVSSFAGVVISVNIAPPMLPVYEQPACPGDGYIWTPGYWAYGPEGYYWVPGTWEMPPSVGLLWTPGYWGWGNGVYVWHAGYWGPHIGFYGGVNYGFGYGGTGYEGGYWRDRHFYYNRTVNNVTITKVHVYNKNIIRNTTVNHISYNGGHGGINARPTHEQERWGREHHYEPTNLQRGHERDASRNREFLASENHGRPVVAATSHPREFHGPKEVSGHETRSSFSGPDSHPIARPDSRGRSYERPMAREEMQGGRETHTNSGGHRSESTGPQDNGRGRELGSPHGNGSAHETRPQHEGRSDHGHDQHPHK